MTRIAPVNLPYNPKTLWFDACDMELSVGQDVVVQTARGTEFGTVAEEVFEATPEQMKKLKTALKPVTRVATDEDRARAAELEQKAADALPLFKELAAETSEEMRPVSVEYLFDGDKAVFYFESENRVDFRELVRALSSKLHIRVDMRQIGVRDEARMVGGLGHCGQELCCKRLGGEFCPVSIRMAKEQDLSLNPQKISGVCGRLMCCLRYEYEAYKDFKSRAPKKNATIETPDGPAKVVDLDVPREVVSLRLEGEKPVKVPLSDFDEPEEGNRPKCVGCDAWERACAPAENMFAGGMATLATPDLNGKDQLADRTAVRHVPGGKKRDADEGSGRSRNGKQSRRGKRGKGSSGSQDSEQKQSQQQTRKPRRRRSTKVSADGRTTVQTEAAESKRTQAQAQTADGAGEQREGGRKRRGGQGKRRGQGGQGNQNAQNGQSGQGNSARNGKSDGKRSGEGKQKQAGDKQRRGGKGGQAQAGPRPGQKSSGLSRQADAGASGAAKGSEQGKPAGQSHRSRRRRSHRGSGSNGGANGAANGSGANGGNANKE